MDVMRFQGRFGGVLGRLGHPRCSWKRLGPPSRRLGGVLEASWAVLGRERWPTWLQVGPQIGAQIDFKSIQKIDQLFVPLGIDFYKDFAGLCQNGTKLSQKWNQKSMLTSKGVVQKAPVFLKERQCYVEIKWDEVGKKNRQKMIQKWSPRYNASWHRFSNDFIRF